MTITFTLQSQYVSTTQAGPFNISGTTSGNVTYELATNVTKTQLTNGYSVNTAYETITGGTICSTGVCTNCVNWSVTPQPTPTATPQSAYGYCYSLTYSTIPNDLYVRYRDMEGVVTTTLIQNLQTMDNGNGTYTTYICVMQGGSYQSPVCVQYSTEVTCDPYLWSTDNCVCTDLNGGSCFVPCGL